MSGKKSRNKGSRGELEAAKIASKILELNVERTPNSGGLWIPGDIQGIPGIHAEVKRQEIYKIDDWWEQASSEAPPDTKPAVIFRKNNHKWKTIIDYEFFLELIKFYKPL